MVALAMSLAGAFLAVGLLRVVAAMLEMAAESGLGGYKTTRHTLAYCLRAPVRVVKTYRGLPGLESRWVYLKRGLALTGLGAALLMVCAVSTNFGR